MVDHEYTCNELREVKKKKRIADSTVIFVFFFLSSSNGLKTVCRFNVIKWTFLDVSILLYLGEESLMEHMVIK